MPIKIEDYYSRATFQKMKSFADQHETPFVVIDLETIDKAYDDLRAGFEFAKVYYAVKANPAVEIIDLLKAKGSSFDIASIYELDKAMSRLPRKRRWPRTSPANCQKRKNPRSTASVSNICRPWLNACRAP